MATPGKILGISILTAALGGLTPGVQAQVPSGGISPFGGELRGVTQIEGKIVCVGCSLEEVRKAHPDQTHLYQLTHEKEQAVMEVDKVNDPQWWSAVVFPPEIRVRSDSKLFRELTAEQNLFKKVTITGLLRDTRVLDMYSVTIGG
jgi:hypothetical protein